MKRSHLMHDTPPEIIEKMCQMMQMKSPIERLKMGCSMYETSRFLIIRTILENDPNISENDLRKEFFLRFYGNDFTPEARKKIMDHLQQYNQEFP